MSQKPFNEMTTDEAETVAERIVASSKSEDDIRRRLTEAGFNGAAAAIASTSHTSCGITMFMAMVMMYGPRGEVISV